MSFILYFGLTMGITAAIATVDKRRNSTPDKIIRRKPLSKTKNLLAASIATVTAFTVLYMTITLLSLTSTFATTDGGTSSIGPASIIMVGGSLGFSLLFSLMAIISSACAIACFETLNFMHVEQNRTKLVLASTAIIPILSILAGVFQAILNLHGNQTVLVLSAILVQNGAALIGSTVTALTISKFEKTAISDS